MSREPFPVAVRALAHLRTHLLVTSVTITAAFAIMTAVSIFAPLAAQINRAEVDSELIVGLADHFLFVHTALWPLIFLSLAGCVLSATVLYLRMRQPLRSFASFWSA
jgi:hypothetical protein